MMWPILSRISARSPPVCLCRTTAVAKNLRSRLGTRSVSERSESSSETPRFCSSKCAAELLADGVGHFVGDQAHARLQAVAGAQRAGDQLQGVGQLRGELLQAFAASQPDPNERQYADESGADGSRDERRSGHAHRDSGPQRQAAGDQREFREIQRRVGLFQEQREIAKPREDRLDQIGAGVQGALLQDAFFFVPGAGAFQPRQQIQTIFHMGCGAVAQEHGDAYDQGGDSDEYGRGYQQWAHLLARA